MLYWSCNRESCVLVKAGGLCSLEGRGLSQENICVRRERIKEKRKKKTYYGNGKNNNFQLQIFILPESRYVIIMTLKSFKNRVSSRYIYLYIHSHYYPYYPAATSSSASPDPAQNWIFFYHFVQIFCAEQNVEILLSYLRLNAAVLRLLRKKTVSSSLLIITKHCTKQK